MNDREVRNAICYWGKSMFDRGLTSGSSGNISVRVDDGFIITPTNSCLGRLEPDRLAHLDKTGAHLDGDKPSKEVPLHLAFYNARPFANAVVHLHSTYATALSCRTDIDVRNAIPPATPYVLMRAGVVPLVGYFDPGGETPSDLLDAAADHTSVLLSNHGPVVSATTLEAAVYAAEEVEEAAKVSFVLQGSPIKLLPQDAQMRLRDRLV